jgi:hypothetical protein
MRDLNFRFLISFDVKDLNFGFLTSFEMTISSLCLGGDGLAALLLLLNGITINRPVYSLTKEITA